MARLQQPPYRHPLGRHLAWLLLIKAVALYLIWLAWFSHPVSLKPQQVVDGLLTSIHVSTCSGKDTCDATHP